MTVYLVTGRHRYREHDPGTTFETELEPDVEARAIAIGAIEVLARTTTALRPGSWTLPPGWHITRPNTEAPEGASLIEGSV